LLWVKLFHNPTESGITVKSLILSHVLCITEPQKWFNVFVSSNSLNCILLVNCQHIQTVLNIGGNIYIELFYNDMIIINTCTLSTSYKILKFEQRDLIYEAYEH